MRLTGQRFQHPLRIVGVLGLAEDHAVEHDLRVGGEHRTLGKLALVHPLPAGADFRARHALDVM